MTNKSGQPLVKECPPPTFDLTSCIRSKFTRKSAHLAFGVSFVCSLRSTTSNAIYIWGKNFVLYIYIAESYYKAALR